MVPPKNRRGQPIKMSFLELFMPSTPSRGSKRNPRIEKPTKEEPTSTETSPVSTAATEAVSEPKKTEGSGSTPWTRMEELGLLGMKAQDMSWKEMGEMLPGKEMENIEKKYRELYVAAPANVKSKDAEAKKEDTKKEVEEAKGDGKKAAEESKSENGDGSNAGKVVKQGNKKQKGQKGQKDKEKAEEAKPEEAKAEEASPEVKKGVLKAKMTEEEKGKGGALKSIDGHPVIFVDDREELEFDELLYLYGLNARFDEQKWILVDSKFFDRFGKRIGAGKLKEKLAGTY